MVGSVMIEFLCWLFGHKWKTHKSELITSPMDGSVWIRRWLYCERCKKTTQKCSEEPPTHVNCRCGVRS